MVPCIVMLRERWRKFQDLIDFMVMYNVSRFWEQTDTCIVSTRPPVLGICMHSSIKRPSTIKSVG